MTMIITNQLKVVPLKLESIMSVNHTERPSRFSSYNVASPESKQVKPSRP